MIDAWLTISWLVELLVWGACALIVLNAAWSIRRDVLEIRRRRAELAELERREAAWRAWYERRRREPGPNHITGSAPQGRRPDGSWWVQ